MPARSRGRAKTKYVAVALTSNKLAYYVWKTAGLESLPQVSAQDATDLGHEPVETSTTSTKLYFYRASAPKPTRMTKQFATASPGGTAFNVSSFVAADKIAEAAGKGWKVTGAYKRLSLGGNSTTACGAELTGGYMYVWSLDTADFEAYKGALGLKKLADFTDTEDALAVRGATFPRPAQASFDPPTGGTFKTFCSTDSIDSLKTANWTIHGKERVKRSYFAG